MNTILTLCPSCAEVYRTSPGVRIKTVSRASTEKKKHCESCRIRGCFSQYHVQSGRR